MFGAPLRVNAPRAYSSRYVASSPMEKEPLRNSGQLYSARKSKPDVSVVGPFTFRTLMRSTFVDRHWPPANWKRACSAAKFGSPQRPVAVGNIDENRLAAVSIVSSSSNLKSK